MKHLNILAESECKLVFVDDIEESINTIFELIDGHRLFIITDDKVAALYLQQIEQLLRQYSIVFYSCILPEGELTKNWDGLASIYRFLIVHSAGRKDFVLNLGGGMISDLGGFAAATYMRGISYINLPTTLLGMVDSGIGGKTAINFEGTKNIIGSFHSPKLTIVCPIFLRTLSENDIKSGMGEVIKYTLISNEINLFNLCFNNKIPNIEQIFDCCRTKKYYVEADAFDNGKRKVLNFGHTFGHAFEAGSNFTLSHGEAVGLGMLAVARFGNALEITPSNIELEIIKSLESYNMPVDYSPYISAALLKLTHDKKNDGGMIDMVILQDMGVPSIIKVSVDSAKEFLTNA